MSGALLRIVCTSALAALLAFLVSACGDLENGDSTSPQGELTEGTTTGGQAAPRGDLPQPTQGVIEIGGALDGSLTDELVVKFGKEAGRSGLAITVDTANTGETQAFADLCAGEVDLADSSREMTPEERAVCAGNGLEVVDFQIAFDAVVVVTRNERDVGADCVNYDQLRSMFEAGTPVSAWNQVNPNFFPIRLTTTGPDPGASSFTLFGQQVLGIQDPTLADFRSDYAAFPLDRQIRKQVVGGSDQPGGAPPGVVGLVGFSYYELFEDQLRPLEIDGQTGNRCVFPSDETISGELYPLERTLRIYTTQRSLDRQEVRTFLTSYLRNSEARAIDNELIPIGDSIRSQELRRINETTGGTSTTAEPSDG